MNKYDQRILAAKIFPEIDLFILDDRNCYLEIGKMIKREKPLRERFLTLKPQDIPCKDAHEVLSNWSYNWARYLESHKKIMRNRITREIDALWWALQIGDEKTMIDKIVSAEWAYHWLIDIGDAGRMAPLMKGTRYEGMWVGALRVDSQYKIERHYPKGD